ncbi:hypothetical protein CLAFUW4_05553 [Fulvia fulva]|uniref:F-box domain-containing protein n=1 Tax=Passalora fulva TaxID=5499 RepID=A0A9Q8LHM8_PASFU|nr:uncharacterized protein CLAFUR5_05695 [Fulvia fulva]KAK4624238.1 hypothetical protein CLAFUR4_05547 [Fulvia fulva]KAK4625553.1 hypothetical protein CLAFUR0_05556 [Fulvia fulva]UJO17811.1 hypothetical protein CLAFUR5_05695 [Fulvia fulva]WPV14962.1 hypothetical protein CLAFUW4_05553 [Fulvia fulva]WPV30141.1 hypothetical protein CLAFUW7_05551 [Fulvia fulva]
MTGNTPGRRTNLTDLPPELLEHITNYLPTASAIAGLGRTSKTLHAWVEKDAWKAFSRNAFPSLCPQITAPSYRETARTLTTVSKAWDKRAFIARYVEPHGSITSHPSGKQLNQWKPPRGQTLGFTPQLDVFEEIGPTWRDREETLAFSAGAEVCIRETARGAEDNVSWKTYRPHSAYEGRDDVTTLHLLRPEEGRTDASINFISGTANGDLQMIGLPDTVSPNQDVAITYFATQGLKVRSSSIYRSPGQPTLLAANLDDTKVALYTVDSNQSKIAPASQIEVHPPLRADGNPAPNHRAWSTAFLSPTTLAVGAGPSAAPLHIYTITDSGLSQRPTRKLALHNHEDGVDATISNQSPRAHLTSIYTIMPMPTSIASHDHGQVFLSGAYDGVVRLHDLRSQRDVEQAYIDPADDGAVYSILPRGREKLMVGTSRHNLLKVFDVRMGAKCYSHQDIHTNQSPNTGVEACDPESDYNIFLRNNNASFTTRGSNWSQGRNRSADSSVYSLASPSAHSPYVYAGVESAVYGIAFAEALDSHPDPTFFEPWSAQAEPHNQSPKHIRQQDNDFVNSKFKAEHIGNKNGSRTFEAKDVLGLAMYDQGANMKLCVQRSLWETWRAGSPRRRDRFFQGRLDERWKGAAEFGQ